MIPAAMSVRHMTDLNTFIQECQYKLIQCALVLHRYRLVDNTVVVNIRGSGRVVASWSGMSFSVKETNFVAPLSRKMKQQIRIS